MRKFITLCGLAGAVLMGVASCSSLIKIKQKNHSLQGVELQEQPPMEQSTGKAASDSETNITSAQTDDIITKDFLIGNTEYSKDEQFVEIPAGKFAVKTIYLQKEVWEQFQKMHGDATKSGVHLQILSGARNKNYQSVVWNRRWDSTLPPKEATQKNLEFIAMPTSSRHHWGTDIDFWGIQNSLQTGRKEYNWLKKNAHQYGFMQVYTSKKEQPNRTGYNEEKWHWSYVPLSCKYLQEFNRQVAIEDIDGFKGAEFAQDFKIIANYVNGVASQVKICPDSGAYNT